MNSHHKNLWGCASCTWYILLRLSPLCNIKWSWVRSAPLGNLLVTGVRNPSATSLNTKRHKETREGSQRTYGQNKTGLNKGPSIASLPPFASFSTSFIVFSHWPLAFSTLKEPAAPNFPDFRARLTWALIPNGYTLFPKTTYLNPGKWPWKNTATCGEPSGWSWRWERVSCSSLSKRIEVHYTFIFSLHAYCKTNICFLSSQVLQK